MADVKISALPAASTPLAGTEVLPIVQNGTTDRVSVANLTAGRTVDAAAVSVGAGTASAPSIVSAGDSNTGVFFPAADTIAFAEGGVESLRLDSGGNATFAGTAAMASSFLRNRIINGDMRIDQRNAGAAVTLNGGGAYTVDRWLAADDTDGVFTAQRDTVAPTGHVNSLRITTTTADGSLSAGQSAFVLQRIEGNNIYDLAWGSASAQTVTLSFWVRSSLTGTFGGSARNGDGTRSYPFTYAISAANTWEYKTVTIPGDTSGTWLTDTGIGLQISFGLGVGSSFSGTAGAWSGSNFLSATGAVSVIGTLNATWFVTGVQLEVGSVATPFERRQFGTELQLCQRYYEQSTQALAGDNIVFAGNVTSGQVYYAQKNFIVPKRATPTITGATTALNNISAVFSVAFSTPQGFAVDVLAGGTGTGGYWARYIASAEL